MNRTDPSKTVGDFEPFSADSYEGLDLTGLAAYAIKRLQDLMIPTTFENLVVTLFRLFPAKFSLHGYEHYPDAARVGRTLLQLAPKYRNWARGSVQKGFGLTQSGVAKADAIAAALATGGSPSPSERRASRPRTMDLSKDLKVIENSRLFQEWSTGILDPAASAEVIDMLGAYAYSPAKALRGRVLSLENAAKQVGRDDLLSFLQAIKREYSALFRD